MIRFGAKPARKSLIALGVAAGGLAVVLLVRAAVQANRPTAAGDGHSTAEAEAAADPVRTEVRLNRPELGAAAGIEVAPVQSRPIQRTISCNASALFNQNKYVKVPPKADGILLEINVDVGANVRAGDVLAVVNSQSFGDVKASYLKARVHEAHARWQIARYKAAAEGIAAKNLFEAQHLLEEDLADRARLESRLQNFGMSPAEIEAIDETKDLGIRLPVVAPRDGTIVWRQAVEGEPVETTRPLVAIADLDTMWVHLFVYESYLTDVHLGQRVTFYPDGLPGQGFGGAVNWISPEVDSETRTIQLRAEVANRDGKLRANMFGKGELLIEKPRERLVVPQAAVQLRGGNHVVFVQKPDSAFEARQIRLGLKHDDFWEVITGLESGERVATTGSFLLKSNLENPEFGKVEEEH